MFSKKGVKLTNEEFKIRLNSFGFDLVDDYINSKTSISFKCIHCNKIFKRKPKELNSVKCSCEQKHLDYVSKVGSKNFDVLEHYKSIRHKILHKCRVCELKFKTTPKTLLNSVNGCPSCSGKKFSNSHYISILPKNIEFLSVEYKGSNYYHLHKCKICNFEWETKPNYIIHMSTSCPNCTSSKGERLISDFLNKLELDFVKEYSVSINGVKYRFDFFIPSLNILIEYDGIQHYKPIDYFGGLQALEKIKFSDDVKNKWCLDNSLTLIRIPYYVDIKSLLSEKSLK